MHAAPREESANLDQPSRMCIIEVLQESTTLGTNKSGRLFGTVGTERWCDTRGALTETLPVL